MRRSLRDAFVGFSLLGGLVIFTGSMLWLRDFRIGSKAWEVYANFKDAVHFNCLFPFSFSWARCSSQLGDRDRLACLQLVGPNRLAGAEGTPRA